MSPVTVSRLQGFHQMSDGLELELILREMGINAW